MRDRRIAVGMAGWSWMDCRVAAGSSGSAAAVDEAGETAGEEVAVETTRIEDRHVEGPEVVVDLCE